jgi:hypothetical protein
MRFGLLSRYYSKRNQFIAVGVDDLEKLKHSELLIQYTMLCFFVK